MRAAPATSTSRSPSSSAPLVAAVLAAAVLRRRNAVYREIERVENLDADGDGVPDCFEAQASAK